MPLIERLCRFDDRGRRLITSPRPEIAIKVRRGKLEISDQQVNQALADLDVRVLSYTREHALRLFGLPWHHADPFDRQILAQALVEEIPVVTPDEAFGRYPGVRVIW